TLKGSLGILAADDAFNAAQCVVSIGRSGDLTGVQEASDALTLEVQRLMDVLQQACEKIPMQSIS
ncbi:MAG: hypothetical protein GY794_09560, partial [bacterium]|nr:hypothetical protein [bacterium]